MADNVSSKGLDLVIHTRKENHSSNLGGRTIPLHTFTYIEQLMEDRFLPMIRLIVLFTNIPTSRVGWLIHYSHIENTNPLAISFVSRVIVIVFLQVQSVPTVGSSKTNIRHTYIQFSLGWVVFFSMVTRWGSMIISNTKNEDNKALIKMCDDMDTCVVPIKLCKQTFWPFKRDIMKISRAITRSWTLNHYSDPFKSQYHEDMCFFVVKSGIPLVFLGSLLA